MFILNSETRSSRFDFDRQALSILLYSLAPTSFSGAQHTVFKNLMKIDKSKFQLTRSINEYNSRYRELSHNPPEIEVSNYFNQVISFQVFGGLWPSPLMKQWLQFIERLAHAAPKGEIRLFLFFFFNLQNLQSKFNNFPYNLLLL